MSSDLNPYQSPSSALETDKNLSQSVQNQPANFKDPTVLTKIVLGLLVTGVILSLISWGSDFMEMRLLKMLQDGSDITENFQSQLENSDTRQGIIGKLSLLLFIVQAISILMWIYRANSNVRQLGVMNMEFSPGWSIGYYFIPLLNFWVPYQAMKEIYRCSQTVSHQPEKMGEGILALWWFLWISSNILGKLTWKASSSTQESSIEQLINTNILYQINALIDIPLSIALFLIVRKIYRMQMAH